MTFYLVRQMARALRHGLYGVLEVIAGMGIVPPEWLFRTVVAIDRPLRWVVLRT